MNLEKRKIIGIYPRIQSTFSGNRLIRGWKKNRVRQIGKNQIIVDINNFTRGTEKW